jgi:nitrate reductase gamma subunit
MSFLWLVEYPLWYFAATVFVVGVIWRLVALVALGGKADLSVPRGSGTGGAIRALLLHFIPHGGFFSKTAFHVFAGYAFHVGFFVLLLFAAPHVMFIEERILGFGWEPLPRWGFILAAEFAFAGLIFLWARRISDPVQRQISDADDHAGTWLTFIAMLTGCLALQESNAVLRGIHMLSVEAWLIYFPFSRLMHAFTWAFSRSNMGAVFGRRGVTP